MSYRVFAFLLLAFGALGATKNQRDAVLAAIEAKASCTPVDCVLGDWQVCSPCSVSCGDGGTQFRSRDIITYPSCGGAPCGDVSDTQPCGDSSCPVDCVVGQWSDFDTCTATCGGGTQTRTRPVTTAQAFGGAACPVTTETQPCNTQACPVDCVVSDWNDCGPCPVSCGGGLDRPGRVRVRQIITYPSGGGAGCGTLNDHQPCNTQCCPVDCVVSDWSDWTECSASCGPGTQTRSREITTPSDCEGTPCPTDLLETRDCNLRCCPVDCVVGEWHDWTACSASCGPGTQTRSRDLVDPVCGGAECPSASETRNCNLGSCPVGCSPGYWKTHLSRWPTEQKLYFNAVLSGPKAVHILSTDITLLEALNLRGNGLVFQLTGAYLNTIYLPGYPYTTQQIKDLAQSVTSDNTSAITAQLNAANDGTGNMCPLN